MRRVPRRAAIALAGVLIILAALVGACATPPTTPAATAPPAAARPSGTVVSLTFDDGNADQMQLLPTLESHGLRGTFYIITGAIGQPDYLTRAQLAQIAAAGNEIGGHTVSHPALTTDDPAELTRQICDGRATLQQWGYHAISFAYPYGAYSPAVEAAVHDCGYASARIVNGLGVPGPNCPGCRTAESMPPTDPYAVHSAGQVEDTTTVADLEASVINAENHGGGWLPFIFHHESSGDSLSGGELATTPALLDQFATWLVGQQQQGRLTVKTVGQVVDQPDGPVHTGQASTRPEIANTTLQGTDPTLPDCWEQGGYGTNTATWRHDPAVPGRPADETITMTSWTSGDAVLLSHLDLGQCTAWTRPGLVVDTAAQYRSTVPTQFAVYRRDGVGAWTYWTSSPFVAPSATWQPAAWTTPPTPPDTTGVAAGLIIAGVGTLSTTGYHVGPVLPPPPPPASHALAIGAAVATVVVLGLLGVVIVNVRRRRRTPSPPREPDTTWGPPSAAAAPR